MNELHPLLGTELPIIQAPMAGVQGSALALAVSNAGGLGSLPCAMLDADGMRRELSALREGTDKPFNVNFFCHTPPAPDAESEARWLAALKPYYDELGLSTDAAAGGGRAPFSAEAAAILAEFEPAVVSFHFGLPEESLLAPLRRWGAKILSTATTVAEAQWLADRGADGIIAQGLEAGGHRGHFLSHDLTEQAGTFGLVPQIAAAVNVPVIAAGGIASAKGVAAVLGMGASAAQIGTSYLLCPEAKTSEIHRAALKGENRRHTALTNVFSGRPARGIVNRIIREQGPFSDAAPAFPLAGGAIAPLRAAAEKAGSGDFSPLWSGQNNDGCCEVPAAELTRRLAGLE